MKESVKVFKDMERSLEEKVLVFEDKLKNGLIDNNTYHTVDLVSNEALNLWDDIFNEMMSLETTPEETDALGDIADNVIELNKRLDSILTQLFFIPDFEDLVEILSEEDD